MKVITKNNLPPIANYPLLVAQWHPTKNGKLTPKDITAGSSKKRIVWICPHGHEWPARASSRVKGSGCPFCSGKRVCSDNCLETTHPEIAKQWHPTKNGKLTPKDITAGSKKRIVWICPHGHEWPARASGRAYGKGCPFCSGQRVCSDNCLETTHPEIAKQWHPTKNGKLTPKDITAGSDMECCWICPHGHLWTARASSRANGNGCPTCNESKGESKIAKCLEEKNIIFKREKTFKTCFYKAPLRFDFFVKLNNKIGFLIEYQGKQHYEVIQRSKSDEKNIKEFEETKKRDEIKSKWAKDKNIKLLIIPYWERDNIPKLINEFINNLI